MINEQAIRNAPLKRHCANLTGRQSMILTEQLATCVLGLLCIVHSFLWLSHIVLYGDGHLLSAVRCQLLCAHI